MGSVLGIRTIFIPNHNFLVRFEGILGEFGQAMVRILERRTCIRIEIPMASPNERLGIYRTQTRPSEHDIVAILRQDSRQGF